MFISRPWAFETGYHYVSHAGFVLLILLPLLLECRDNRHGTSVHCKLSVLLLVLAPLMSC